MFNLETSTLHTAPRVLLVDDDLRMLTSLRDLLKGRGYDLVCAQGGRAALELLDQGSFELVILDLHMPEVSGHDVMDFMNIRNLGMNVIVTSGASEIDAAIGAIRRGAFGYLRKPYTREELLKTVGNALRQSELQAENKRIALRLESSEKMYRSLVDSSPDIIYTLDQEGRFTFVNDRVQQLLGFTRDELIGKHYSLLIHDADMERANYVFNTGRKEFRHSRSVELRMNRKRAEGDARTFSIELVTIDLGVGESAGAQEAAARGLVGTYGVARDITDRKRADEQITYQAYHDILTDLPNRALFRDRLGLALLQAKRNENCLAVMFLDLDRFKVVNDTFGHGVGDSLLQQVSLRLKACLRRCDTLSRIGGDEFTAVLPELNDRQDAVLIAEKFVECLRQPFQLAGQAVHVSASIGISLYPQDGRAQEELVRRADMAMYHMKSSGKNGYAFFDPALLDTSLQKITLEHDLHLALERGELEMFYQPQIDVATHRMVGAEALMRWNHPQRGFLGAAEFLPFAEESGLMIPISDWMLEAICRDLLDWNLVGGEPLRLSLNISPQYLDRGDFFDKLKDALLRHQISPHQIEVEVTENICIRNPQKAIEQLDKLCQLGVSVAIDDFGTGYSSLSYLHRFPIHTIKIDRSFVMEIRDPGMQFPVVLAIVAIAQGLGLNLVAEGVETPLQAGYLADAGCRVMQGFLYHQPKSQAMLLRLLQDQMDAATKYQEVHSRRARQPSLWDVSMHGALR
ncbi:two-component system response regulator [Rhodoferax lacus]|uniref:Two-component system response regulator n=1 Tax=Rhodoferax lacus TaxID=2184758 RepID=A0A3E1RET2_9BURK|nr:EAL domain-containing protein [Rhodoferax lacus]RFO97878.1 two-component system response regulator [Rhodoferax lacus]